MSTETAPIKMSRRILLVFSLLMLGIIASGYLYYEKQKAHYFSGERDILTAIADLKVKQISNWRAERLADAQAIMENTIVARRVKELLDDPMRDDIRKELTGWMDSRAKNYGYDEAFLLDINGKAILSIGVRAAGIENHFKELNSEAIRSRKVIFNDFHKLEDSNNIHLDIVIPLFLSNSQPAGSLVVVIDPDKYLYPFIQTWPVPSRTAETLLARREGNDVLFLNELRHQKNTTLVLRFPLSRKEIPAVKAVSGEKGVVEGLDYRGIPVIAFVGPIPDSPWFIVAKRDKEEIYENFQHDAEVITFVIIVLISVSGMGIILWLRKQEVYFYRQSYNAELQLNEERKKAEVEINRYMADLKRSNEELKQFAYIASHDLQEPLRMIASYMQLIERRYKGKLDKDADEFIAFAVDGATRLQEMITGLLHYSRLETRGNPLLEVNSSEMLGKAVSNLKVVIEESGALVSADRLPVIRADASQFVQVFQNLIANAIKFKGEAGPHIHVSAEQKGNEWVFAVKDNGIGIAAEYSDRIFNIFQRLHGREYPGVGIGLSLCRRIVERHGGRIWFESEAGKGTTFYFTIPIKEAKKNE